MAEVVYVLCAAMSLACAILLVRAWAAARSKLLLWSSVCFVGLFVNNVIVVIDAAGKEPRVEWIQHAFAA